ncbi:MAG: hypothetical protein XD81_1693, partial [Bacteroidetes bacterium 38_7]
MLSRGKGYICNLNRRKGMRVGIFLLTLLAIIVLGTSC